MNEGDPKEIVVTFNDCINNRDLDGLSKLMAEDHTFIDTENNVEKGKERMIKQWDEFFKQFPDYQNHFPEIKVINDRVIVRGRSTCSSQALDGPALWTAKIDNGLVSEWRVYKDTPENRTKLGL